MLITGGNKGIGFEIAKTIGKKLVGQSHHIIITSRDAERGREAVERLAQAGIRQVECRVLNLEENQSIDSFLYVVVLDLHDLF